MARRLFTANVTVYTMTFLGAKKAVVVTECGKTFEYQPCPKPFDINGCTKFKASFKANDDGSNPRSIKLLP